MSIFVNDTNKIVHDSFVDVVITTGTLYRYGIKKNKINDYLRDIFNNNIYIYDDNKSEYDDINTFETLKDIYYFSEKGTDRKINIDILSFLGEKKDEYIKHIILCIYLGKTQYTSKLINELRSSAYQYIDDFITLCSEFKNMNNNKYITFMNTSGYEELSKLLDAAILKNEYLKDNSLHLSDSLDTSDIFSDSSEEIKYLLDNKLTIKNKTSESYAKLVEDKKNISKYLQKFNKNNLSDNEITSVLYLYFYTSIAYYGKLNKYEHEFASIFKLNDVFTAVKSKTFSLGIDVLDDLSSIEFEELENVNKNFKIFVKKIELTDNIKIICKRIYSASIVYRILKEPLYIELLKNDSVTGIDNDIQDDYMQILRRYVNYYLIAYTGKNLPVQNSEMNTFIDIKYVVKKISIVKKHAEFYYTTNDNDACELKLEIIKNLYKSYLEFYSGLWLEVYIHYLLLTANDKHGIYTDMYKSLLDDYKNMKISRIDEEKIIIDTKKFIKNFDIKVKTVNLSELGLNNDIIEKLKKLLKKLKIRGGSLLYDTSIYYYYLQL